MSAGDDVRTTSGGFQADPRAVGLDPVLLADPAIPGTGLLMFPQADALPAAWVTSEPAFGVSSDAVLLGPPGSLTVAVPRGRPGAAA